MPFNSPTGSAALTHGVFATKGALRSPLLTGLIDGYKFDTDPFVSAIGGPAATKTGTVNRPVGKIDLCARTTTGGYLTIPAQGKYDLTVDFTLAAWFKVPNVDNYAVFLDTYDGARGWSVNKYIQNNGISLQSFSPSTVQSSPGGAWGDWSSFEWRHLALTYAIAGSGGGAVRTLTLYVNGVEAASVVVPNDFEPSANPLTIGNRAHGGGEYPCFVDELYGWNRVLSPEERALLVNGGVGLSHPFDRRVRTARWEVARYLYPTSHYAAEPASVAYALGLGADSVMMAGEAELNRSMMWGHLDTLDFREAVVPYDDSNLSNPPVEGAVKLCAKLAKTLGLGLATDIENASTTGDPVTQAMVEKCREMAAWAKAHNDVEVSAFGEPNANIPPANWDAWDLPGYAAILDTVNVIGYATTNAHTSLGGLALYKTLAQQYHETLVDRLGHPGSNGKRWVVTLNPTWQISGGPADPLWHLHDTPLPADYWYEMLTFWRDRGYDFQLWMVTLTNLAPVQAHIAMTKAVAAGA